MPGIRGIGPKTATKLIQEHGDLEAALAAAPEMKPGKLRDSLIEQADMARLSRVLVQLKEDCPLPIAARRFRAGRDPARSARRLPRKARLHQPAQAAGRRARQPGTATQLNPAKPVNAGGGPARRRSAPAAARYAGDRPLRLRMRADARSARRWIARAFAARLVAFDTETSALDAMQADLVGVSLALGPNQACYIPLGHGGTDMFAEKPPQIDRDAALARLKPLLESDAVLKVGQNAKYDLNVLARYGIARWRRSTTPW